MAFTPLAGATKSAPIATANPTSGFTPLDLSQSAAPAPAPAPSLFSKIGGALSSAAGAVVDYAKSSFGQAASFEQQLVHHPVDTLLSVPSTIADGIIGQAKSAYEATAASRQASQTDTGLQGFADRLSTLTNAAKVLLSPITGTFDAAQHYPVLKQAADVLGVVPTVSGIAASYATGKVVDVLPISQQSKDILKAPLQDAASLIAQVTLGDKIIGKAGEYLKANKEITPEVAKTIVDEAHAPADTTAPSEPIGGEHPTTPAPTEKPATQDVVLPKEAEVRQLATDFINHNYPEDALATRLQEMFPDRSAGIMEDIARSATAAREVGQDFADRMVQGIKEAPPRSADTANVPPAQTTVKEPDATLPKPLANEAKSKIGKSIEAKAIEAKLTEGFKDTAGFDPITIKDQAERAASLVNTSLDDARAVVRGEKPLPEGLRGTALITALEQHLVDRPNADLAYELANSPLTSATSAAAQEMRLMAERVPDSLTAKFKEIKAAREAALEKRGGAKKSIKKITDDINKEIKKTASKRPTWEDFAKEIACNY